MSPVRSVLIEAGSHCVQRLSMNRLEEIVGEIIGLRCVVLQWLLAACWCNLRAGGPL